MAQIRIESNEVPGIARLAGAEHLYLVFEGDAGEELVIRAGPENRRPPYGNVDVLMDWPLADSPRPEELKPHKIGEV